MGEYDAFGRKADEDPLAEIGWRDEHTPGSVHEHAEPEPVPVAVATDATEEPEPPPVEEPPVQAPVSVPAVAAVRRFVRLFVLLVTVGVGASAFFAIRDGIDSVPDITIPAFPDREEPAPQSPSAPPSGLERGSLIRRTAFAEAISRLRGERLGRVRLVRLAADRIDVQLLTAGSRLRSVQIEPGPRIRELSVSGPGFGHLDTIPFAKIDTAAPERFVRRITRRRGVSPTRVDYLVLMEFDGRPVWNLYFKDGSHFRLE